MRSIAILFVVCCIHSISYAQTPAYTYADSLRGGNGSGRAWWNLLRYDIDIKPDFKHKSLSGNNTITYTGIGSLMQIDLQVPLIIDSIIQQGSKLSFRRVGNAFFIKMPPNKKTLQKQLRIYYHGSPRIAVRPPWDGGWIFTKDKQGRPWMTVACQGLGASVWYPCKDYDGDEPDSGASLRITVPDTLVAVANGRLAKQQHNRDGTTSYTWRVINPINNYDIVPYIGKYVHWGNAYAGLQGKLDCSYWVMDYNLEKAKKQFVQADSMLQCFEHWFGPYPFYQDGYKLVEAPHLGMEHQSDIAYGNHFQDGYLGRDLSHTGRGLSWDFIIIHESAHEWFGNNITAIDNADMWIHESFANYAETIYTGFQQGEAAANTYCIGIRKNIANDRPIIAAYGVNAEGSGDMYYKGGNMIHMIRQLIADDEKFRDILIGLNKTFYHQTVTTAQVENYISNASGIDLSSIFNQYLRTAGIPLLEYSIDNGTLRFHWADCVDGFNMPLKLMESKTQWIKPSTEWQSIPFIESSLKVDSNFLVRTKNVK